MVLACLGKVEGIGLAEISASQAPAFPWSPKAGSSFMSTVDGKIGTRKYLVHTD